MCNQQLHIYITIPIMRGLMISNNNPKRGAPKMGEIGQATLMSGDIQAAEKSAAPCRADDVSAALAMNAVPITNTYGALCAGYALTWEDVRFRQNYFAALALNGGVSLAFSQGATAHR